MRPLLGRAVLALLLAGSLRGVAQDDMPVLRLADAAREANLARLLSWQGKARIERTFYLKTGEVESRSVAAASFVFDRWQQATRWERVVQEFRERKDGKLVAVPDECRTTTAMRRDGARFRFTHPGKPASWLSIRPTEKTPVVKPGLEHDFDPMWLFTVHGWSLHDLMVRLCWTQQNPGPGAGREKREGNLITWSAGGTWVRNIFVFDLAQGGNVIHYHEGDGMIAVDHVWTYRQFGEVWVPESYRSEKRYGGRGKEWLRSVEAVTLVESRLNVRLPASEFAVERMGVRVGTQVVDDVAGLTYRFGEPDGREATQDASGKNRPRTAVPTVAKEPADALPHPAQ
jgi:hypothetical protein